MEYTIGSLFEENRKRIADIYKSDTPAAGTAQRGLPIGTKKEMGGRMMIKTANGWVPDSKGKKGTAANEERSIHGGQGAKVVEGSHITNKEGFTGEVKKVDETHHHIGWKDKEGKEQVTKVPHDVMHEKMTTGEFKHHVPADKAHEATGAAGKEKLSDPTQIKTKEEAFDQLDNYFKGDKDAEATIKFLKDTIGSNDKIRFDPGMTFDDDRVLGLSYPDGRFGVNATSPLARDKENVYRTMMHEMVHAATRQEMKTNETLQDEFNGALGEIRKHFDLPDNDALVKRLYADGAIGEDHYGASDQYELIAEVFTNQKFAELLKSIPVKKDNLLKKVMTSIFAAFSKTSKKVKNAKKDLKDVDNMADYLVGLTTQVFKPEAKKDEKKEGKVVKMGGKPKEDKMAVAAKKALGKDEALPKMAVGKEGKLESGDKDQQKKNDDFKHHRMLAAHHAGAAMRDPKGKDVKEHLAKGNEHAKKAKELHNKKEHGGWMDSIPDQKEADAYAEKHYASEGKKEIKKSEDDMMNTLENDFDLLYESFEKSAANTGEIRYFNLKGRGMTAHVKSAKGHWTPLPRGHAAHQKAPQPGHGSAAPATHVAGNPEVVAKLEAEEPKAENPKVNINERFAAAGRFVKAVISGAMKAALLYGTGGVGKTYEVTARLEAAGKKQFDGEIHQAANLLAKDVGGEGDDEDFVDDGEDEGVKSTDYDWVKITGYMSAPEVYRTMYEHNGKTLVFDDCDKVLQDSNSVNLFKGALDTSGDGTISYSTKTGVKSEGGGKLPKSFKFTGRAIFISNLSNDQVPQPIKSRALRADLTMSADQTIERLRFIAKNKEGKYQNLHFKGVPNYTHEEMEDVLNFLDKHKHNTSDLNVRTVGSMLAIKKIADQEGEDWRKDAEHMIFSKSESEYYNGGAFAMQKAFVGSIYKSGDMMNFDIAQSKSATDPAAIKSLEFRGETQNVDKAMGSGNTPGMETVEDSHGKAESPAAAAVQKSQENDLFDILFKPL